MKDASCTRSRSAARVRKPLNRALAALLVATFACATLLLAAAPLAWGRPGGGQSFSGGSRSSSSSGRSSGSFSSGGSRSSGFSSSGSSGYSSGGSSGADGLVFLLFESPALGVPLCLLVIGFIVWSKHRGSSISDWSTGAGPVAREPERGPSPRRVLERLRGKDPNFSLVLFEDFVTFLFSQVHEARGRGAIDELAPYASDEVRAILKPAQGVHQVKGIVLGAMRIVGAKVGAQQTTVEVEFEANMTEVGAPGSPQTEQAYYIVERWTLARRSVARSREPQATRTLGCPNCGAPRSALRGTRCTQCNTAVGDGAFDWNIVSVQLMAREGRPPLLTGTVDEQGTDLPTVFDDDASERFAALQAKDPETSWPALQTRASLAWSELQTAWNAQDLSKARPFLSDAQFQSLLYWIETYRRSGLKNVTEAARITNIELVRVTADRFYDAVTVRLYATGLDYTLDKNGKVVAGNRSRQRPYSEYWTLIRGSQRRGAPRTEPVCPNCGAPLAVNMAGTCTYCNVVVTTGEFDWVISRIEQDEAYEG